MIMKATEARTRSVISSEVNTYLSDIEKLIDKAIDKGQFNIILTHDIKKNDAHAEDIIFYISEKLTSLGYSVDTKYAKPLPSGCPTDQWDFNNGYIKVNW